MLVISVNRGMVNATGEGIRGGEMAARDMVKEKVVFREGQLPSSLSSSQLLCGSKVQKVLVISKDDHWMRISFEKVPPRFESADDGEEFAIVNLVIPFGRVQGLREVAARMVRPVAISLKEYSPCCKQGGISG